MIDRSFVQMMAQYNEWQNQSLYNAADGLSEEQRQLDRGAVFSSIQQTLSHLLWGDQIWMSRFADFPEPAAGSVTESRTMIQDWEELKRARIAMDDGILSWSKTVTDEFLGGQMSWYSGSQKRDVTASAAELVVHMFNHQTHHRGQVHAMITAAEGVPDDTDLFILSMRRASSG